MEIYFGILTEMFLFLFVGQFSLKESGKKCGPQFLPPHSEHPIKHEHLCLCPKRVMLCWTQTQLVFFFNSSNI